MYCDPAEIDRSLSEILRPPQRISVSEAAEKSLHISTPGGYSGHWDRNAGPYMAEPMDAIRKREFEAVFFVGPAQSLKTFSLLGGAIAHAAVYDPADQIVVHMTQDAARDWSRKELDRWIRSSDDLKRKLSPRPRDDNTFDKFWRTGSIVKIAWPSVTQLSSKSVRDVLMTDYDRMPDDIDGEGSAFGLARQRVKAWRSRGVVVVESSPGRALSQENAKWKPSTPHEPPPVGGILGLYSDSDRRRWYWPCPHCGEYWEPKPGLECFGLPEFEELKEEIEKNGVSSIVDRYNKPFCPHCGETVDQSHKRSMNIAGRWLRAGQVIDRDGVITGDGLVSRHAGFWLGGMAAVFQDWPVMVERYAQAVAQFIKTGEIFLLKETVGTDQAMPFRHPGARVDTTSLAEMQSVAETWQRGSVPSWVRFLVGSVDVQVGRFVVQIFGISPGPVGYEWTIVDRFAITKSRRQNELGEFAQINPPAYLEDWDLLLSEVINRKYKADGGYMPVIFTVIDSGGQGKAGQKEGETQSVTEKAYAFWRGLNIRGLGPRVRLVKGSGTAQARVEERFPDTSGRKGRGASRGDVPVLLISTNALKDSLAADLSRAIGGDGSARWPDWLPADVFAEMTAETRTAKGWVKPSGARNEATDLAVYCKAACIFLGTERPGWWDRPPQWATSAALVQDASDNPTLPTSKRPQRGVRSRGLRH